MKSQSQRIPSQVTDRSPDILHAPEAGQDDIAERSVITLRTKLGEELEGLEAYRDGITFRARRLMPGGKIVELVIAETILMEAEVVGCASLPGNIGGYLIRARFHNTSQAMSELICAELSRLLERPK